MNGCFVYKDVEITNIRNIELVKFENTGLIIEADVDVSNPNFYSIKVFDSDLTIYLDGDLLGKGKILNDITLESNFEGEMHLELDAKYKGKLSSSLRGIFGLALGKEIELKIEGTVKGKAMGLTHEYPLELTQMVSL